MEKKMKANGPGALAGVRIIDLTRILGGPYGTQILADHGAEIIKIEPPQGDDTRDWGPPFENGDASYFMGTNRNKLGFALDLTREEGQKLLLHLLADADVLIENLKIGTMEKWNLGYETLAKSFPRLIYCRISGFGADGPYGGLPGYDAVIQAMSGMMSVNGEPDGEALRLGVPIVDMGTGLFSANGVLMALLERERSGKGQMIDMALFDCAIALLHPVSANCLANGKIPQRYGNAHSNITPYDKFATGSCDIYLAVGNDRQFRTLMEHLGKPELASDKRFMDAPGRNAHRDALRVELLALLRNHDGLVLCDALMKVGIPAGPVFTVRDVMAHPQTQSREMVVRHDNYTGTGIPIKLSRTPGSVRRAPPRFAEHASEILAKAGYTSEQIEELIRSDIVPTRRRR